MDFETKKIKEDKKKFTIFNWKFDKKEYEIKFKGWNRRANSFGWLLGAYPKYFNVHDELIKSKYDDSNKAINNFINDEGFKDFVLEKKIVSSKKQKINSFKLDLKKICNHLDRGGVFAEINRKQPNKKIIKELLERSNSSCEITGYKLYSKKELKEKKINFLSKMLEIVFDHRVPLFQGGSDDNTKIDNWQVLSWYVNNEKNKICKNCYETNCDECALAYPEKNEKIKPTNQNLKNLFIL